MTGPILLMLAAFVFALCVIGLLCEQHEKHKHRHDWVEHFGGLYADEEGGPRYVHEIWWECDCGATLDRAARDRAYLADEHEQYININSL